MPIRYRHNPKAVYTRIKSPDDPRIVAYASLKGKELEKDGIFIAEGAKVVESMLQSGCRPGSLLTAENAVGKYKAVISQASKRGAAVYVAPDALIERIIGFRFHKGIMAVGYCPKKRSLSEALERPKRPIFLAALNRVNDPQNVGLIARTAAAFAVQALVVDNKTYDPYYRKSVRVSMGAVFGLTVCYEYDLAPALLRLKSKYSLRVIAAVAGKRGSDISKANLSGNVCFVFGNEDKGVSGGITRIADEKVRIPISPDVDSLNVALAAAICLYEASRRRRGRHGR
jgi:tRNA G18 (ribose-2'-O)-methylase SpoU